MSAKNNTNKRSFQVNYRSTGGKQYQSKYLADAIDLAKSFNYSYDQLRQIEQAFELVRGTSFEENFAQALGLYGIKTHNTAFSSKGTAARDVRSQALSSAIAQISENFRQQKFDVAYEDPLAQVQRQRSAGINTDLSGTVDAGEVSAAENDTTNPPFTPETSTGVAESFGVFTQILGAVTSGISMAQQFTQLKGLSEAAKQAEIKTAEEIEKSAQLGVIDTLSLQKEFENGWKLFSSGKKDDAADAAIDAILKEQQSNLSNAKVGKATGLTSYDPLIGDAVKVETDYHGLDKRFTGKNRQRFREAYDRHLKSIRTAGDYYSLRNKFASERDSWAMVRNSRYYSDSPGAVFDALSPLTEFSDEQRASFAEAQKLIADFNKAYYYTADGQLSARSDNAAAAFNAAYLGVDPDTGSMSDLDDFAAGKRAAELAAYKLNELLANNQERMMQAVFDITDWLSGLYNQGNLFQKISAGSALTAMMGVQSQLFGQLFSGAMQSFGGPSHVSYSSTQNTNNIENAASVNGKGVVVTPTNHVPE